MDIIKKGKISARIKFMLQDVQDLRSNQWVPRVRQDKQLKTIDQVRGMSGYQVKTIEAGQYLGTKGQARINNLKP